jgi:hypothetical protein
MDDQRVFILGIYSFSLVIFAVLGGLAQQFDFLLPFEFWDFKRWAGLAEESGVSVNTLNGVGITGHLILAFGAFTSLIFAAVTMSLFYPSLFLEWGGYKLSGLIIPLVQIIMFGMGSSMSPADFAAVVKSPKGVFIGVGLQFLVMKCFSSGACSASSVRISVNSGLDFDISMVATSAAKAVLAKKKRRSVFMELILVDFSGDFKSKCRIKGEDQHALSCQSSCQHASALNMTMLLRNLGRDGFKIFKG